MWKGPEVECGWNVVSERREARIEFGEKSWLIPHRTQRVDWLPTELGWGALKVWGEGSDKTHEF